MIALSDTDPLRLEYQQATELLRDLTDVRFKLLALLPTITGVAVALLGRGPSAAELLSVGSLGLVATVGVVAYELRNTRLHDHARGRAVALETELGLHLLRDEPGGSDRGLALVHGAVLGGWSYLVAWGALHAAGVANARPLGGLLGALAGLALLLEFRRLGSREGRGARAAAAAG